MGLIKKRWLWLSISGTLVALAIIFLIAFRLKPGLDFSGGSFLELQFKNNVKSSQIENVLTQDNISGFSIQKAGDNSYFIKFPNIDKATIIKIRADIKEKVGENTEKKFETVGPSVSRDLTVRAYWSVGIASLFIILYIAYAFRKIPKPANSFRFGVSAIIALVHDCVMVLGLFALLGHFWGVEIDSMFITAILTILGFFGT